jgi:hypothetical protein
MHNRTETENGPLLFFFCLLLHLLFFFFGSHTMNELPLLQQNDKDSMGSVRKFSSVDSPSMPYSLEQILRICRSTGPKEILMKLAVNRHLLLVQISAIRIQSIIRKYLAKIKYWRFQRHFQFFQDMTFRFHQSILEEVILSFSLEITFSVFKAYHKYTDLSEKISFAFQDIADSLFEEVIDEFCSAIVIDVIENASTNYLIIHK